MKASLVVFISFVLIHGSVFSQGSLTPPGPPGPTMKTLQQIEPRIDLQNAPASAVDTSNASYHFIINQAGSYYLSANLGVTKTNGIRIVAEGVTLDLNGFEVSRAGGSGGTGIEIQTSAHRASVRNGSIKGFNAGIETISLSSGARGCAFRDLAVSACTNVGIEAGSGATLEACRVQDNSGNSAMFVGQGSTLLNCTARFNSSTYGLNIGTGSSATNCVASQNSGNYGIHGGIGVSLTNCAAFSNSSSAASSAGIYVDSGSTVIGCASYLNSSTNATHGPSNGAGFDIGGGSLVKNCSAYNNSGDGLSIISGTTVLENTAYANGTAGDGAGIHVSGSANRIEGNHTYSNDRGIDVDGAGNIIVRNSARANGASSGGNYAIAAENRFGPVVDLTASGVSSVTGKGPFASTLLTTDPWANFSY